jgi:spermidine/putrescine transport system ATP-binding protein
MQSELKALQRRLGLTFIFVTHDQEEALSVSDRVAVMRDGIIQQIGSPRQIYQNPVNLFVAGFVGESNILPGLVVDAGTAGRVDVRVEQRTLSLRTPLVLRSGDTVHLLIRPEDVRVARGEGLPAATDSCQPQLWLDGVVTEKTYKGVTVETAIRLESGRMLMACEFINGGVLNADDGAGQRVRIGWMANRETLLPVDAT